MTVYAHTAPGASFPEYINVKMENEHVVVTVRSPPTFDVMQSDDPPLACCSPTASIKLTLSQAEDLARELTGALHGPVST